jgi:hypothetical protein
MIQAYRYGSLTRIPEFREFRERLERSVHFAAVTAEQMLLELTHSVRRGGVPTWQEYSSFIKSLQITSLTYEFLKETSPVPHVIMSVERDRIELLEDYIVCSARLVLSFL